VYCIREQHGDDKQHQFEFFVAEEALRLKTRVIPPPTGMPHSHGDPRRAGIPACPGPPRCLAKKEA
jgi:hypothetical protein